MSTEQRSKNNDTIFMDASNIANSLNTDKNSIQIIKKILDETPIFTDMMTPTQHFIVLASLNNVLKNNISGSIVELGCNCGGTSIRISRLIDAYNSSKSYHVYDTFMGLPMPNSEKDNGINPDYKKGSMYCPISRYANILEQLNVKKMPVIHQGLFAEINVDEYPNKICFAFFDGDIYDSIIDSFKAVWNKLSIGGLIVIDDYKFPTLPGVERACTDYFKIIDNMKNGTSYRILYSENCEIVIEKTLKL
jgi:O-methyltransferase